MTDTEIFSLKHTLKCGADGKFRILLMSDLHGGAGYNRILVDAIDAVIEKTAPGLVVLGGDTVGPQPGNVSTEQELREYLTSLTVPMEKRHIPWAHVFGNHDDNWGLEHEQQEPVYEEFPYCVSKNGPENIDGAANYVLPILSSDGDRTAFAFWGLDSHSDVKKSAEHFGMSAAVDAIKPVHTYFGRDYDHAHFNQVIWYYNTSKELERRNGKKVPSVMFTHIPVPEFCTVFNNRAETGFEGNAREDVGCSELNFGLFAACVERGDVLGFFAGHDHVSDFTGKYCGITLGYDAGMCYDCYQDEDLRGARVVELDENYPDEMNTYMVRVKDIM